DYYCQVWGSGGAQWLF
nr:immunoglobulin light chain junction region [Macaca mulatta]MOW38214.1 immunoglobulin light chain junction region [Macaca mulatta]